MCPMNNDLSIVVLFLVKSNDITRLFKRWGLFVGEFLVANPKPVPKVASHQKFLYSITDVY